MARLSDARDKVRINGFRPGKVPMQHLRKMYGKSFMAEVVNEILNDSTRTIITGRGEKAAMQPEVIMTEDEKEAEKILAGGTDFEFKLNYEVIPAIEIKEFTDIKVKRPVYDVPESEIDEQVKRVAELARTYEAKDGQGRRTATASPSTMSARSTARPSTAAPAPTSRWSWARRSSSRASRTSWSAPRPATRSWSP